MRAHCLLAWLSLGGAGCADLLDIPSDPRLVEESRATAEEAGSQTAATVSPDAGSDAADDGDHGGDEVDPTAEEISPPHSNDNPDGGSPGNDALDSGGSPSPPPAGDDAGAPQTDAASPLPTCQAPETLGPDGNCFLIVATLLDWPAARLSCQQRGAGWDLATLQSAELDAFASALGSAELWIGASDAETEGTWRWVTDGLEFWSGDGETGSAVGGAYARWNGDEPNGGGGSDCARLVPAQQGAWADLECEELRASLCTGPQR